MPIDFANLDPCPDFPPQDENGVDLCMIRHNLMLTPTQRLEQNDRFAEFVRVVREAGRRHYELEHRNSATAE